jgi:hypothetical protein
MKPGGSVALPGQGWDGLAIRPTLAVQTGMQNGLERPSYEAGLQRSGRYSRQGGLPVQTRT